MRKYRLIKQHPGSPPLDTIVEFYDDWTALNQNIVTKNHVVEYPEFWEEIKEEPTYLITAFRDLRNVNTDLVWRINSGGGYQLNGHSPVSLSDMLNTGNSVANGVFEIYSVKNSKGEEFILKEKVEIKTIKCVIMKFTIIDGKMSVNVLTANGLGLFNLEDVNRYKTPIFVSADSKEMFEGDKYYVPQINGKFELDGTYLEITAHEYCKANKTFFSTKELAQEYIDNNKPKYSLEDVKSIWFNDKTQLWDDFKNELKSLDK